MLGLLFGTLAGLAAYAHVHFGGDAALTDAAIDWVAKPVGQLFLSLLFMLVLPLMFSAVILGVADLGDVAALGRIGTRTLASTIAITAVAVLIGLIVVNVVQPGVGFDPTLRDSVLSTSGPVHEPGTAHPSFSGVDLLLGIVPRNVLRAAVEDQFLAVMFFGLMLGVALVLTPTPATSAFKSGIQGLNELLMTLIGLVIRLTPVAVACLMFTLAARFGWNLLFTLGKFVFTVLLAIALHMFVVLPLWVRLIGGMAPRRFFGGSRDAIVTAFSTASSAGTLPVTIRAAEENLCLPSRVARFILTIGASANHHGTALFEGLTVLFLAQCFGAPLGLAQQALLLGLCVLASVGTAGVPAGSLPVIAMILGYLHLPPEGIGLILGVDRLLDMCRTALNVTGDLATAVVVARGEGAHAAPAGVDRGSAIATAPLTAAPLRN